MSLLEYLDGIRETGKGRYLARCPAHDDRNPSLSIRECDDGRVLLHCFAGCEVEDILSAVGLRFADIMPEHIRTDHRYKPQLPESFQAADRLGLPAEKIHRERHRQEHTHKRQYLDARQVLAAIRHELIVVVLILDHVTIVVLVEHVVVVRQRIGCTGKEIEYEFFYLRIKNALDLVGVVKVPALRFEMRDRQTKFVHTFRAERRKAGI